MIGYNLKGWTRRQAIKDAEKEGIRYVDPLGTNILNVEGTKSVSFPALDEDNKSILWIHTNNCTCDRCTWLPNLSALFG